MAVAVGGLAVRALTASSYTQAFDGIAVAMLFAANVRRRSKLDGQRIKLNVCHCNRWEAIATAQRSVHLSQFCYQPYSLFRTISSTSQDWRTINSDPRFTGLQFISFVVAKLADYRLDVPYFSAAVSDSEKLHQDSRSEWQLKEASSSRDNMKTHD